MLDIYKILMKPHSKVQDLNWYSIKYSENKYP